MTARARTVFLGTGGFALPALGALARHSRVDLRAVVTAPPRPRGRGAQLRRSPVAGEARELGLAVLTPARLREPDAVRDVLAVEPDLIVLADYGQIVPAPLLDAPAHGALNLHPSLLPRHRGATPIPAAILAGDPETGVSLMLMDAGLDTGPLIAQARVPLRGEETAPELEAVLADLAARILVDALPRWLDGTLQAVPQREDRATLTRPLDREDGRLDPARAAAALEPQVRAYQPWPGSFVDLESGRLVVWRARVASPDGPVEDASPEPGTLTTVGERLYLTTVEGRLELLEVQPAGGRRMSAGELLRGRPSLAGSRVVGGRVR